MRVLYIHQYFKTPEESGVLRSYHLARGLVKAGHEVEMLTGHNQPHSETKVIQGIKVHYLPVSYSNQMGFGSRVSAFLKFAWLGSLAASRIKKVDPMQRTIFCKKYYISKDCEVFNVSKVTFL